VLYPEATIASERYARFSRQLRAFLVTPLTREILGNFLRHSRNIQRCFQLRWPMHGVDHLIPLERLFAFEEGCSYLLTDDTRPKLMEEVEDEEFQPNLLMGRIVLNDLEDYLRDRRPDINRPDDVQQLKQQFACDCLNAQVAIDLLLRFCRVEPRLPEAAAKRLTVTGEPLGLTLDMDREAILARIESIRDRNPFARLAFYAYRDLNRTEAEPFLVAALERNPVSIAAAAALDDDAAEARIRAMPDASIYDGPGRLAQPDEVWNYGRGDGAEKALLLANLLRSRHPGLPLQIDVQPDAAVLTDGKRARSFPSTKDLRAQTWRIP
jgi:hypothetical protein